MGQVTVKRTLLAVAMLACCATAPAVLAQQAAPDAAKPEAAKPAAPVATPTSAEAAPEAEAPPRTAAEAGTPAVVIDNRQIESVLGRSVASPTNEDLGRIVDLLVDHNGKLRAAVIDFGGFFGVGSRKIAVDWHVLHFMHDAKADAIVADLPNSQLRVAPVYKEGEPVVVLGRAAPPPGPAASTTPEAKAAPAAPVSFPPPPAAPAK